MKREDKDTLFFIRPIFDEHSEAETVYHLRGGLQAAGRRADFYFLNLPVSDFRGPRFLINLKKNHEKKNLIKIIDRAHQTVRKQVTCTKLECLLHPAITERLGWRSQSVPLTVYEAMLRTKAFDKITIHIPEEGCMEFYEPLPRLLEKHLPHINQAVITGSRGDTGKDVENWLNEEYGIPAFWQIEPLEDSVIIDLGGDFEQWHREHLGNLLVNTGNKPVLNPVNAWKFLDTTANNGYNTKVN